MRPWASRYFSRAGSICLFLLRLVGVKGIHDHLLSTLYVAQPQQRFYQVDVSNLQILFDSWLNIFYKGFRPLVKKIDRTDDDCKNRSEKN